MKELRDIKIDLLTGSQNPVIDLFYEISSGIEIVNCHVYENHGLEFIYHKDGQWIFYQDCKNEKFWGCYNRYWSLFESNFGLNYVEIQSITKYLVEEALKREVITPVKLSYDRFGKVEEALKREVATPTPKLEREKVYVQDALKREVATPSVSDGMCYQGVEDALKREISKPKPEIHKMDSMVLDALKRETEKE